MTTPHSPVPRPSGTGGTWLCEVCGKSLANPLHSTWQSEAFLMSAKLQLRFTTLVEMYDISLDDASHMLFLFHMLNQALEGVT